MGGLVADWGWVGCCVEWCGVRELSWAVGGVAWDWEIGSGGWNSVGEFGEVLGNGRGGWNSVVEIGGGHWGRKLVVGSVGGFIRLVQVNESGG